MVESSAGKKAAKPAKKEPVLLTDPRAIKALAHPARLAVIDEFFAGRKLTATECAEIAGLSASAMSYHLRALEKWGIIRRSQASEDGRERPWEAAGDGLRVESAEPRASAAVESTLISRMLDRERSEALDWMGRAEPPPKEWIDAMSVSSTAYWLTASEARELATAMQDVVEQFYRRSPDNGPEGTKRVRISYMIVPTDREPGDHEHELYDADHA
jgi:DNA-binding transcriptional ArsR family regulator